MSPYDTPTRPHPPGTTSGPWVGRQSVSQSGSAALTIGDHRPVAGLVAEDEGWPQARVAQGILGSE